MVVAVRIHKARGEANTRTLADFGFLGNGYRLCLYAFFQLCSFISFSLPSSVSDSNCVQIEFFVDFLLFFEFLFLKSKVNSRRDYCA